MYGSHHMNDQAFVRSKITAQSETFANFAPLRLCEKLGRAMKVSRKGAKFAKVPPKLRPGLSKYNRKIDYTIATHIDATERQSLRHLMVGVTSSNKRDSRALWFFDTQSQSSSKRDGGWIGVHIQ
jgi:hypothetical protein